MPSLRFVVLRALPHAPVCVFPLFIVYARHLPSGSLGLSQLMPQLCRPRSMYGLLNATTISTDDDNTHLVLLCGGIYRFVMTRVARQGSYEAHESVGDTLVRPRRRHPDTMETMNLIMARAAGRINTAVVKAGPNINEMYARKSTRRPTALSHSHHLTNPPIPQRPSNHVDPGNSYPRLLRSVV
jgi:hypothetical protein